MIKICSECLNSPCLRRCPNYIPPKTSHCCFICNEGIQDGEEYIVNDNKDYAHFECVDYARDLAEFLGYEIREMEDDNY